MNDPTITTRAITAPTDTSKPPTSSAFACAIATQAMTGPTAAGWRRTRKGRPTISTGCRRPPDHQQRHQQERRPRDPACRRRAGTGAETGAVTGTGDRFDRAAHASSTAWRARPEPTIASMIRLLAELLARESRRSPGRAR